MKRISCSDLFVDLIRTIEKSCKRLEIVYSQNGVPKRCNLESRKMQIRNSMSHIKNLAQIPTGVERCWVQK